MFVTIRFLNSAVVIRQSDDLVVFCSSSSVQKMIAVPSCPGMKLVMYENPFGMWAMVVVFTSCRPIICSLFWMTKSCKYFCLEGESMPCTLIVPTLIIGGVGGVSSLFHKRQWWGEGEEARLCGFCGVGI